MTLSQIFASRASRMQASEIRELLKLLDQPGLISFAGGIPDPALFPASEFAIAFANGLGPDTQAQALQYSVSEGYMPLRQWIVGEMAKIGVPCTADNILITSGSQQALDYLGKVFLSPGDTALVGWPTYLGALAAFNAYEPRYDQLTANGNRKAESYAEEAENAGGQVKFAYLSADFANPTGETLDQRGRESLLDLTESLGCALIEDAAYQSLRYDGEQVPPLLSLEIARKGDIETCRTIYCGTFSKTLSPGLRVGWVVAAKPVISKLVLLKQAADLHSPTLNQMAMHEVAEEIFDGHVETLRDAYRQRRDAMLAALDQYMPANVSWRRPEGGMFIWVTLPTEMDGAELLAQSLESIGVAFVPGRAFFADGSGGNTIRLSFSCSDESEIRTGIEKLGGLLREM
ncbi:PLP-dependent aminotransferase family protein [Parasedimentitalea maritima]|uniref:PLP-dependent aminotransferase family protein n=1 Tax=Parasedimentitalea maritima TaxID=2578117 RepID=A0ABY2USU9_9RHOB|nr:PLP-dependent aminotransferase family protein [Zongyanglinia marina]TLP61452.1 PLP-dependent aminotransferase family protein [Zongyanglinia marina]